MGSARQRAGSPSSGSAMSRAANPSTAGVGHGMAKWRGFRCAHQPLIALRSLFSRPGRSAPCPSSSAALGQRPGSARAAPGAARGDGNTDRAAQPHLRLPALSTLSLRLGPSLAPLRQAALIAEPLWIYSIAASKSIWVFRPTKPLPAATPEVAPRDRRGAAVAQVHRPSQSISASASSATEGL